MRDCQLVKEVRQRVGLAIHHAIHDLITNAGYIGSMDAGSVSEDLSRSREQMLQMIKRLERSRDALSEEV